MFGRRFGVMLVLLFTADVFYPLVGLVASFVVALWIFYAYLNAAEEISKENVKTEIDSFVGAIVVTPLVLMISRKAVILPVFLYIAYRQDIFRYFALTWKDVDERVIGKVGIVLDWRKLYVILPYIDDFEHVYVVGYGEVPLEILDAVKANGARYLSLYRGLG